MLHTDERLAEFDGFIQVVTHARVPRVGNRAAMPECTGPELAPSLEPPDHGAAGDIGRRCVRGIGHPLAPHQPAARVDRGLDLFVAVLPTVEVVSVHPLRRLSLNPPMAVERRSDRDARIPRRGRHEQL
jgi:hypothetical protein